MALKKEIEKEKEKSKKKERGSGAMLHHVQSNI